MKVTKSILLMAMLLASSAAFAYSPEELGKECHKPKFTDFTLKEYHTPENIEVAPESEFSFRVSIGANEESIKLTIKNKSIPFTLETNSSFHQVNAKLPAEFTGKFARLNVSAIAADGICHETTGWLLKVKDKAPEEAAPVATETAPAVTPAPAEVTPEPANSETH